VAPRLQPSLALVALLAAGCTDDASAPSCDGLALDERAACLVGAMTLEEKMSQMHGSSLGAEDSLYHTPALERLGLPGLAMVDGPRGVRAGHATAFPVGMARGATWDVELEERVGEAIGLETAAKGGSVLLAPTINLLRHPGWGRAQETYGEDTVHVGKMGAAFITGAQRHVMASAKHFAANSIEDTRFEVDVTLDERTLRELYLPHFHAAVEAGVASVMSAYNQVNGHYCAENAHLLRDILKGEWGFRGFVESDWVFGTRSTVESALAGLDIEMPGAIYYGDPLQEAVERGEVPVALIDDAVTRVVRRQLEYVVDRAPVDAAVVESAEHLALAHEAAAKAIVLLKNDGDALPLGSADSVAVVGALAEVANLGDDGSSDVDPTTAVTPVAGLLERLGASRVTSVPRDELTAADEAVVSGADATVVVVGLTAADEGESIGPIGGDRDSLALSAAHQALIAAVAALAPRTIVVLEGGAALTMESWLADVEAVLMAWYPGQQGGLAIADVLTGAIAPSGRLPITFPVNEAQLPPFDHESAAVTYGYFHGYRHIDHEGQDPLFPFGFGLAYTTFSYDSMVLSDHGDGTVTADVTVTNDGTRAGAEVVQLYAAFDEPDRAPLELKAFARISLEPGETATAHLDLDVATLARWDEGWQLEGDYRLLAGSSSRDLPLEATLVIP
jgi:beta-glucosidase